MMKNPTARFALPAPFYDTRPEGEEMRLLPTLVSTRTVSFAWVCSAIFSCILGQVLSGPGRLVALLSFNRVGA